MPRHFPSAYTLFDRLLALWDRFTSPARRGKRRPARLGLEAMEDRLVPASVWVGPSQTVGEGGAAGCRYTATGTKQRSSR